VSKIWVKKGKTGAFWHFKARLKAQI